MAGFESIISGGLMVIVYTLVLVAIYRVFQIGADVSEIKQLLKKIERNTAAAASPDTLTVGSQADSPEALVRAIHAASYQDLDATIAETSPRKPA